MPTLFYIAIAFFATCVAIVYAFQKRKKRGEEEHLLILQNLEAGSEKERADIKRRQRFLSRYDLEKYNLKEALVPQNTIKINYI